MVMSSPMFRITRTHTSLLKVAVLHADNMEPCDSNYLNAAPTTFLDGAFDHDSVHKFGVALKTHAKWL